MRKQLLSIFLIAFSNLLYSQDVINNVITEKHQNVPGTKICLIPPAGFIKASNLTGFHENENGSSIIVVDMSDMNPSLTDSFTKEAFLSQGVDPEEIREFKINELDAILITRLDSPNSVLFSKTILILSNDEEVILIDCSYQSDLPEIGDEITKSILTIVHLTEEDPLDEIDFSVRTDSTDLILAIRAANSLIYTHDGKFPSDSERNTSLIIAKYHSHESVVDRKLFVTDRIKQAPFDKVEIDRTQAISIDGISGYEVYAKGVINLIGLEFRLYQVILFADDVFYIFFGSTASDDKKTLEGIELVVKSFKRI